MSDMTEELKPCPRCGNKYGIPELQDVDTRWRVMCVNMLMEYPIMCGLASPWCYTKEDAIKWWNEWPTRDNLRFSVEMLQKENARLRAEHTGYINSGERQAALVERLTIERDAAEDELADVTFAARMPSDYQYGLPSWINTLYGFYVGMHDSDGNLIPRSEDVLTIAQLRAENQRLTTRQPCGHPAACIISSREGTSYCGWCEEIA